MPNTIGMNELIVIDCDGTEMNLLVVTKIAEKKDLKESMISTRGIHVVVEKLSS